MIDGRDAHRAGRLVGQADAWRHRPLTGTLISNRAISSFEKFGVGSVNARFTLKITSLFAKGRVVVRNDFSLYLSQISFVELTQ